MNKEKTYYRIAWGLVIAGSIVTFIYLNILGVGGFGFWGEIDMEKSGQFGDYIGGFIGTLFSLAGFIFLYLTLKEQRIAFKKERFENHFFELIKLHRENINELHYSKYNEGKAVVSTNRKVIRIIFQEFIECYREVKKFSNSNDPADYLNLKYQKKLEAIKKNNGIRASVIEMAIIDIAYSVVFFGVGVEGEAVLRDRFKKKYNGVYFFRLLAYLKLKPKEEKIYHFSLWVKLKSLELKDLRELMEEIYFFRRHTKGGQDISETAKELLADTKYEKYYGGHQHRLGHYFRHLFQSYKFLNENETLTDLQKYFYAKTFRAQLSTYEQALIFINSITSLGMKWEYDVELSGNSDRKTNRTVGLITKYHLIKNLPGNHSFGITYKDYYPKVNYENNED